MRPAAQDADRKPPRPVAEMIPSSVAPHEQERLAAQHVSGDLGHMRPRQHECAHGARPDRQRVVIRRHVRPTHQREQHRHRERRNEQRSAGRDVREWVGLAGAHPSRLAAEQNPGDRNHAEAKRYVPAEDPQGTGRKPALPLDPLRDHRRAPPAETWLTVRIRAHTATPLDG
jgi:hypothetical protein